MVAELTSVAPDGSGQQVGYILIDKVRNDVPQVRRDWRHDEGHERLDELTQSIRTHGLLQPIEVVPADDGSYHVLAGHRRYVAAKRAGLSHLPAIVREASDEERIVLQLAENLHRHNLSAIDEADAYACLIETHGYSVPGVAQLVGLSAPHVHSRLRVRADAILADALRRGLIAKSVAAAVTYLGDAYAQMIYRRLESGHRITEDDIREMRTCKERDGVYVAQRADAVAQQDAVLSLLEQGHTFPSIARQLGLGRSQVRHLYDAGRARRPDWCVPTRAEVRAAGKAGKAREAHRLREAGLTFEEIGERIGCSLSRASAYLKESAPSEPNVTFNGVSLDPIISKAQERAAAQPAEAPEPQTPPHPRPTHSPLPWENHDAPRLVYSVDPAGLVDRGTTEAVTQPANELAPRPRPAPEPASPVAAPAGRPASAPAAVEDPDVARLCFMLCGAQQPCRDVLAAVLNLGREKGWTCQDLWRKVQAAQRPT